MARERRPPTEEELIEFRDLLLRKKEGLWEEVRDTLLHEVGEEYQDRIQTIRDQEDLVQAGIQEETVLGILDARKSELEGIAQALWRMDAGEYGKCLECGRWIRHKRLRVRPWSSYCTDCKKKMERSGGLR
jgi:DnaK suppressor protein